MSYQGSRPRGFNIVSFFLLFLVLAGAYLGWKFGPVYWQARKVDEALDELKMSAATFYRMQDGVRQQEADKILARSIARLHEMGLEDQPDQPIQVWFSPDWKHLQAKYMVIVKHPFGKPTVLIMERKREVPGP
jgi:hypothetical protein